MAAGLKAKHELEMEEAQLKSKMERMVPEISLAKSNAGLRVLENGEQMQNIPNRPERPHDGMNEYLENYEGNPDCDLQPSPIKFDEIGAMPKTPLQRMLNQQPNAPERA